MSMMACDGCAIGTSTRMTFQQPLYVPGHDCYCYAGWGRALNEVTLSRGICRNGCGGILFIHDP